MILLFNYKHYPAVVTATVSAAASGGGGEGGEYGRWGKKQRPKLTREEINELRLQQQKERLAKKLEPKPVIPAPAVVEPAPTPAIVFKAIEEFSREEIKLIQEATLEVKPLEEAKYGFDPKEYVATKLKGVLQPPRIVHIYAPPPTSLPKEEKTIEPIVALKPKDTAVHTIQVSLPKEEITFEDVIHLLIAEGETDLAALLF